MGSAWWNRCGGIDVIMMGWNRCGNDGGGGGGSDVDGDYKGLAW